jgi:cytosine deaminase
MRTLIRRVHRLREAEPTIDILIEDGVITGVAPEITTSADSEHDCRGGLALPTFVNTHLHLDKCLTGELAPPAASPTLQDSVEKTWAMKRAYTVDDIVERASEVVKSALTHGTTTLRAFADVDPVGGTTPVEGLCALRDRWRDQVTIEVVAFPQEGIVRSPGTDALLVEAMDVGADVVGGMPWYEQSDRDAATHVDFCLDLAQKRDVDVHMLVDDTDDPTSRSLEYLALEVIRRRYQGRVAASHCGALAAYDHAHAERVMQLVAAAAMTVVSNPHISLVFAGRSDRGRIRRGITRVRELKEMGVNVAAAQDDVNDPYYPFGRADQLEVAQYMCHVAQLISPDEIAYAIDMVTENSARAMRLPRYGLAAGNVGDVVVYRAPSAREALRLMEKPLYVFRRGHLLVENTVTSTYS